MSLPVILSGTTLWVSSSKPVANTLVGFNALNFTQIRAVKVAGDIEKSWQTFQRFPIDGEKVIQSRSFYSHTNITFEMLEIADAGQSLLKQSMESENAYSFKLLRNNNTGIYFTATGIKRRSGFGEGSALHTLTIELAIEDSPIDF